METNITEPCLLLLKAKKEIYPFNIQGLTVSQSTLKEEREYIGSILIFKNGSVKSISKITRKGLYGRALLKKLLSLLFGAYEVEVELSDSHLKIDEVLNVLIECIENDKDILDSNFFNEPMDVVINDLRKVVDIKSIFKIITLPNTQDCLDVL